MAMAAIGRMPPRNRVVDIGMPVSRKISCSNSAALCLLALAAQPGWSAEWTTSAGVAPALTYTDNVCLSADDEQGEWIGLLTPDIAVQGVGARASFDLFASVEMNTLTDSKLEDLGCNPRGFGSRSQFAPRLRAAGQAELVDQWLFLQADADVRQSEITPFGQGGGDTLNRTGNTNDVYNYRVSPYISRRFKDTAVLDLRYSWDQQRNSERVVGDSDRHRVSLNLSSVPGDLGFTWGVQGSYDRVEYDESRNRAGTDNELKSVQLNLGYQFNSVWQVNGYYGEERNDFISVSDEIDGDFWDVGVRWTPNSRTTVDVGTGDRFFGDTPRGSVQYRHKRSTLRASYVKDITYDRDIRSGTFEDEQLPGDILDPTTISNSPILDERFTLGYSYSGRRSNFSVQASHSDQTRAEDGRDSTFKRFSASLDRQLSRYTTLTGRIIWNEQIPRGERSELVFGSETWRYSLEAQRDLNQELSLRLRYEYTDRESDRITNEYQENRLTLTLNFDF